LLNKINQYLDNQEDSMLSLLEDFVNTDSGTYDKKEVDILGNKLKNCFEDIGFAIEQVNYKEYGNCLVGRFNQHKNGKKILLIGHFDTVFPKGEANARPFKIIGEKAYGPGVGDMKSGLVSMLYSLKTLKHIDYLNEPVSIILNSHEEIGSIYSRDIILNESKNAGLAINLEPARDGGAVVTGRKGAARLEVFIEGKAAHSGKEPQKGANANLELAHRIIELQNLNDFYEGLTVNVNVVSGGYAWNVISDKANAKVDIRFVKRKDFDNIYSYITNSLSKSRVPKTKCISNHRILFFPMERRENVLFAYSLVRKAADELGININETFTGGCGDIGFVQP